MHTLSTSRLLLEPFTHQLMLVAIDGREALSRHTGYAVAEVWPNQDLHEAQPFIASMVGRTAGLEEWSRLIVLRGEHSPAGRPTVIGEVGFKSLPDAGGAVEIGYGVASSWRGRGYASEAVAAICRWAFQQGRVSLIRAECLPSNLGSVGVLRRSGFRERGSDSGMLRWELPTPPG